jgi:hypothetical protein
METVQHLLLQLPQISALLRQLFPNNNLAPFNPEEKISKNGAIHLFCSVWADDYGLSDLRIIT